MPRGEGTNLHQAIVPPEKTVSLSGFTSGVYPSNGAAAGRIFNAAEQSPDGTDDLLLCVHPIRNDANTTYLMPIKAAGRKSCRFDYVLFSGSTVSMDDITLFEET